MTFAVDSNMKIKNNKLPGVVFVTYLKCMISIVMIGQCGVAFGSRPSGVGTDRGNPSPVGSTTGCCMGATRTFAGSAFVWQASDTTVQIPDSVQRLLDNLVFEYRYDHLDRVTHTKIPGAECVYRVYDKRDRLVFTQDGEQRKTNQWSYTRYDVLDRPVVTGIYTHAVEIPQEKMAEYAAASELFERYNGNTTSHGYTTAMFRHAHLVQTGFEPLVVTYYDNYNFRALWGADSLYRYQYKNLSTTVNAFHVSYDMQAEENLLVRGQTTGTKIRTLPGDGTPGIWMKSAIYYDNKYRLMQTVADNARGGIDIISQVVDFTGKTIRTFTSHKTSASSAAIDVDREMQYDNAGRLLKTFHQIGKGPRILVSLNRYNELGQLVDKKLHSTHGAADGSDARQSVDYRYNIRGWMTSINNAALTLDTTNDDTGDLFGMNLAYEQTMPGVTEAGSEQYNGNIAAIAWSSNLGLCTLKQRGYGFTYDALNRLTNAYHKEFATAWTLSNAFKEYNLRYDLNGNIQQLHRTGIAGTEEDRLYYTYHGNQLLRVKDNADVNKGFIDGNTSGNDYTYDDNGNMTHDANKKIATIDYNFLNLPRKVTKNNSEYLTYTYDAGGRKYAQQVFDRVGHAVKKSEYAGEFYYENGVLQFISHEEGRVVMSDPAAESNHQVIYTNEGATLDGIFYSAGQGTDAALETQNGHTYVKVTNYCLAPCYGASTQLHTIAVTPGETYRIRIKGYYTGPDPVQIMLRSQANPYLVYNSCFLPQGAENEALTELSYTIPLGVNDLLVSLVWFQPGSESGQTLHINSISLSKVKEAAPPEYQYNLKDHLGNVRLTFTTKDETETNIATLEDDQAETEQGQFLYYNEAVTVNQPLFDHTHRRSDEHHTTTKSTRLLGDNTDAMYGLAKSISVMPGDVINMEVYAKYVDTDQTHWNTALQNAMAMLGNPASPGAAIDNGAPGSMAPPGLLFPLIDHANDATTGPKAYLNYIVFGRDMSAPPLDMGFVPIPAAAKESGTDIDHMLMAASVKIKEAGFIYIYLSNENATPVEVFFDDFKVEQVKSPVVQTDDYYPFGLTFNSHGRESSTENRYLYNQGVGDKTFRTERIYELGLNVDQSKYRTYDYITGRWWQVDPKADEEGQEMLSPYHYSYNNPVRYNDPFGDCPSCFIGAIVGAAVEYSSQVAANVYENGFSGEAFTKNIDVADIAIAAGEGFLTSGASAVRNVVAKTAIKVGAEVLRNAVDAKDGKISTNSVKSTVVNTVIGLAAGKVGDKLLTSKANIVNAKSPSQAVRGARDAGQKLTTKERVAIEKKAAEKIATAKSVNETLKKAPGSTVTGGTGEETKRTSDKNLRD